MSGEQPSELLMRRFLDLHTHSTASDGSLEPEELIELAEKAELAAVALTDHDTTSGLDAAQRAAAKHPELHFVPGIEVSAKWPYGVMHILGLGIDAACPALQSMLSKLRVERNRRNPKIIAKLRQLGMEITMGDVLAVAGVEGRIHADDPEIVGRLHIAQAMQRAGCVGTVRQAFERYIGEGRPAYVDKERLGTGEVIAAIHEADGLAILAHPVQLGCHNRAHLRRTVRDLAQEGLDGVEVYHTDHSPEQTRLYLALAEELRLGVTGGSDFHGQAKPEAAPGRPRFTITMLSELWRQRLVGR